MKSPITQNATISGMQGFSWPPLMKWGIVLGLVICYLFLFPFLERVFGLTAFIPTLLSVALVAWYFGWRQGLAASFLSILLNIVFLIFVESDGPDAIPYLDLVFRLFILVVIAFLVNLLRGRYAELSFAKVKSPSQEKYLTLLNDMTRGILLSHDLDLTLTTLAVDMARLIGADDCYITRWDDEKQATIPTATTAKLDIPYARRESNPDNLSLTASVLRAGHAIAEVDVFNSPYISIEIAKQYPARSVLGVPLIAREHKLGAAIIAFNTPHHFTAKEIDSAEQAGKHIALALWSTQQEIELQKRLKESDTLAKIATSLSETEHVGLSNVLDLIVNSARQLLPSAEQAVIHLLNDEQQTLTSAAVAGYQESVEGKNKMRLGEGIAGQVFTSGETINIADISTDSRFIKLNVSPKFRSLMVAPIISGEQRLGTISVQSNSKNAFTQGENKLLSALGTQAAIAIENAHLLESTQQALKESNALYRVNQGLVASLDPDELLKDTAELLQKNFGYHFVQIFVADSESGDFVMRAGSGEIGAQLKASGHRIAAGDGIVGYAAETGTSFFTNDVDDVVFFTRNPLLPDIKSELSVPVKAGGEILGVLDIQQVPPKYLSQRDLQLVSAVADQLAIALQKASLYEELQISLQQEKSIRNQLVQNERLAVMGRLLASVSHELNNPLQAIQNALFLLKEEKGISSQGQQDLYIVLAESERMANMIERLRATYRPTQVEDFHPTQLNEIIEDIYALISPHLRQNQLTLEFNPQAELPAIPALSDQIRQVVLNLVMNAAEAMSSGDKITVSTKLLADSNEILLTVSDTGTGISPALLPTIFEAFVTNKQKGTGLGLTITYDIVLKHGGRITAENNPQRGSVFKVWLPTRIREIE